MQFENHSNYNCHIQLDDGHNHDVYANWIHNNNLDHWQGWICHAGDQRVYIDPDLKVWSGECCNDDLGSAVTGFQLLEHTRCTKDRCTGCTDDLMIEKHDPNFNETCQTHDNGK